MQTQNYKDTRKHKYRCCDWVDVPPVEVGSDDSTIYEFENTEVLPLVNDAEHTHTLDQQPTTICKGKKARRKIVVLRKGRGRGKISRYWKKRCSKGRGKIGNSSSATSASSSGAQITEPNPIVAPTYCKQCKSVETSPEFKSFVKMMDELIDDELSDEPTVSLNESQQ